MDRTEFADRIMKYKDSMYRFAMSYMHSEAEAKDVVQDVLMKLWETRRELEEKNEINMTLEKEKIENLFLMMSMKDEDIEQAHQAYGEFYKRYENYLYAVTNKVCSNFVQKYGDTLTESVFSNTILKE